MKEYLDFEFSQFSLIGLLIITVIIAVVLKILKIILLNRIKNQKILNYYPLFIVIIWFSFISWSINILLKDSIYQMIAFLTLAAIILLSLSWYFGKDLFAGLILRLSDNFNSGENLCLEQNEGIIIDIGFLGLTMQTIDGTLIKIPWSKINGQIYSKGVSNDISNRQSFSVKINQKFSPETIQNVIREAVFLSIGASLKKEPQIMLKESTDNDWHWQITVFAIEPQYTRLIKANVEKALDDLSRTS